MNNTFKEKAFIKAFKKQQSNINGVVIIQDDSYDCSEYIVRFISNNHSLYATSFSSHNLSAVETVFDLSKHINTIERGLEEAQEPPFEWRLFAKSQLYLMADYTLKKNVRRDKQFHNFMNNLLENCIDLNHFLKKMDKFDFSPLS